MAKFWAVFKREYLERVRTKWFIISTVLFPVLMGAAMIVPGLMSARTMRDARVSKIYIYDVTGTGFGKAVQSQIVGPTGDANNIRLFELPAAELAAAESLATDSVRKRIVEGYLVIDSAAIMPLEADSAGMRRQRVRYAGRNASNVGQMEVLERAVRQSEQTRRLEREGLDPSRIAQLTRINFSVETERITDSGRGGSAAASLVLGFAVVIVLYMSLVIYGQTILRSVLEEKTTRVAEVVMASIRADILLAGKVIGVAAVGLTQQAFWLTSAFLMWTFRTNILSQFGITAPPSIQLPHVGVGTLLLFLAFFVLGFMFYAGLFAAAGAMVNSDQDAQQAATPITLLIVFAFIFFQPILLAPEGTLAKALSLLPFSSPMIMPLRLSIIEVPIMEQVGSLLVLALSTAAAVWVSARIYRVGLLMYGKRPTLRELAHWIRQA
jgi:ABC-2 type transport system permease protein